MAKDYITESSWYFADYLAPMVRGALSVTQQEKIQVINAASSTRRKSKTYNANELLELIQANTNRTAHQQAWFPEDKITILPYETGHSHFALIVIDRTTSPAKIIHQNPTGAVIDPTIKTTLEQWYNSRYPKSSFAANFIDLQVAQQQDGYNCGPITVQNGVDLAICLSDPKVARTAPNLQKSLTVNDQTNFTTLRRQQTQNLRKDPAYQGQDEVIFTGEAVASTSSVAKKPSESVKTTTTKPAKPNPSSSATSSRLANEVPNVWREPPVAKPKPGATAQHKDYVSLLNHEVGEVIDRLVASNLSENKIAQAIDHMFDDAAQIVELSHSRHSSVAQQQLEQNYQEYARALNQYKGKFFDHPRPLPSTTAPKLEQPKPDEVNLADFPRFVPAGVSKK